MHMAPSVSWVSRGLRVDVSRVVRRAAVIVRRFLDATLVSRVTLWLLLVHK